MLKSGAIVIALLVHAIYALVIVPLVAIPRWSGFTMWGISATIFFFSIHAAGIFGIVKRLKWGYTVSKCIFCVYMVASGLGLLGSLARFSPMTTVERAVFFLVFTWLFTRFQSDASVRAHFERSCTSLPETTPL